MRAYFEVFSAQRQPRLRRSKHAHSYSYASVFNASRWAAYAMLKTSKYARIKYKACWHDMHLFNFRSGTYNANPYALSEPPMSLSSDDVKKIAHLARLNMSDE